jgi:hypothetical protein
MKKDLDNIKSLIDFAVSKGLFNNADSVGAIMDSYRRVAYACEVFERVGDSSPMKKVPDVGLGKVAK